MNVESIPMKRAPLHQRITELLDLISVNHQRLYLRDSDPENIDVDLLKKYVLELYEQVLMLDARTVSLPSQKESQKVQSQPAATKTVEHTNAGSSDEGLQKEEASKMAKEPMAEPVESEANAEVLQEPLVEQEQDDENRFKPGLEKIDNAATPPKVEPELEQSINERMGGERGQKLYEKYNLSPIASIRKSISLMKRFEYQKALFNDNAEYYNDALRFFDEAGDLANALEEFKNLSKQFDWDVESDLVQELQVLIERRYLN